MNAHPLDFCGGVDASPCFTGEERGRPALHRCPTLTRDSGSAGAHATIWNSLLPPPCRAMGAGG
eukprot:13094170-Alexandrium_andersonii.AAC.1